MKSSIIIITAAIFLLSCGTAEKKVTVEDLWLQLKELQNANAYSNTKQEELSNRLYSLQEIVEENKLLITQLRANDPGLKKSRAKSMALVKGKKRAPRGNPRTMYDRNFSNFTKKNYTTALAGFQRFVRSYPKNKRTPEALYWIGEIYYDRQNFSQAIKYYSRIPEEFPLAKNIDSAILKLGFCYMKLGQTDLSKAKFKEIVEIYPNSNSAIIAKQQLEKM